MPTDTRPLAVPAGAATRPVPRLRTTGALVAASLLAVAVFTLTPAGSGWAWGDPLTELRWYADGLGRPGPTVQLLGNLALLAPTAVLAVLRWPWLTGRLHRLAAAALAAGASIELLQWVLPLGRVVSPVDALLNAAGAVLAGGLAGWAVRQR